MCSLKRELWKTSLSFVLLGALTLGMLYYLVLWQPIYTDSFSAQRCPDDTLMIDAGHGGEDGGAVSVSGVPESGINLAISLKLDQVLGLYGIVPILLRTEDISLHDIDAQTLHEKKVSDLHNRVATIESVPNATLISIHQNTYQSQRYHGAQVFYTNGDVSLPFAALTQDVLKQTLDPENNRVPAKIPDTVYLMKHITCRAILVECGFLSNPDEDQLLQSSSYQTKIAAGLAAAWLQYQTLPSKLGETNLNKEA